MRIYKKKGKEAKISDDCGSLILVDYLTASPSDTRTDARWRSYRSNRKVLL